MEIDFNKRIQNTDKFRQPAIRFIETGTYCTAPKGTTEYVKYWQEEQEKCINGWHAEDGDYISGYNYFYLNYCPILRLIDDEIVLSSGKRKVIKRRDRHFADFWDYDYFYFLTIQAAQEEGKHVAFLKKRGCGASFKSASMLARNYSLIPNSRSCAVAAESEFLIRDGLLTKAWDMLDFIGEHTPWGKLSQVANTKMHRRASYLVTDDTGKKVEQGYKSEILGLSLKNDPNKIRGRRVALMIFEEAGKFPEITTAWRIAQAGVEESGIAFGLMIAQGTSGEQGSNFEGLRELFLNPKGYNIKELPNIWDEAMPDTNCGFFFPEWANMTTPLDYHTQLMDQFGNSNRDAAIQYCMELRKPIVDFAKERSAIDRYVMEHPLTVSEAMLELGGNIFPKSDLLKHISYIQNHKEAMNHKQIGKLHMVDGKPQWEMMKYGDVTQYPLQKGADPTGAIVIWEHPPQDEIPYGLYIAGCDPYDFDGSLTDSLGSCFIYKRHQTFESYSDTIVAEYTGRPDTAEQFYENVRRLLIYYNAKLLYENEKRGLHTYFTQKHCEYLLADQPNELIKDIIQTSKVNRVKGIHMNKYIKVYMEGLIKEWLEEEYKPGVRNLTKLLSIPLLQELTMYDGERNADRVIAFGLIMLYREQLYHHKVKELKGESKKRQLFEEPIFTQNMWGQSVIAIGDYIDKLNNNE